MIAATKTESEQAKLFAAFRAERDIAPKLLYASVAALSIASLVLVGALTSALHRDRGPVVVRIDDVGRAQAVGYASSLKYMPQAPELKYFLDQFLHSYYTRNRITAHEDFNRAAQFLSPQAQRERMARERTDKSLERFLAGDANSVDVQVENVVLGELKAAPYNAQVDLVKIYRAMDGSEIRREKCVDTVWFELAKDVPASVIAFNPLGLMVTKLPVEDVAYSEVK